MNTKHINNDISEAKVGMPKLSIILYHDTLKSLKCLTKLRVTLQIPIFVRALVFIVLSGLRPT